MTPHQDATRVYAPDLDNAAEWITHPAVPVLDEHEMVDEKKGVRVAVTADVLREICDRTNRRAVESRNPCPLIVGHTSDDPQAPERPVVGYAVNFRVLPFATDPGRMCIYADYKVRADRPNVLRDYPRRSVELWLERREIDPIALLGGTTPERDLGDLGAGVLKYQRTPRRTGETLVRCQLTAHPGEEPTQMAAKCDTPPGKGDQPAEKKPTKLAAGDPDGETPAGPPAPAPGGPGQDAASGDPTVDKVFADARMVDLMEQVKQIPEIHDAIQELLEQLKGGGPGEPGAGPPGGPPPDAGGDADDADGLEPDEDPDAEPAHAAPPGKPKGPPDAEDRKSHEPPPVRLSAAGYPGATGGFVPDAAAKPKPKEQVHMSRATATPDAEVVRLQRRVQELEDLRVRDAKAKEAATLLDALADGSALKDGTRVKFARRDHDVATLTEYMLVNEDLAKDFVEGVKLNYAREPIAPADRAAPDVARYARGDAAPAGEDKPKDAVEAQLVAETVMRLQRAGEPVTQAEALKRVRLARAGAAVTA